MVYQSNKEYEEEEKLKLLALQHAKKFYQANLLQFEIHIDKAKESVVLHKKIFDKAKIKIENK